MVLEFSRDNGEGHSVWYQNIESNTYVRWEVYRTLEWAYLTGTAERSGSTLDILAKYQISHFLPRVPFFLVLPLR